MMPLMAEYLDRIVQLCRDRGVALVLVKTPTVIHTPGRSRAVQDYADEHGLLFVDFNHTDYYYSELSYDFWSDNGDGEHANLWGAEKLTDYMGTLLYDELGVEGGGPHPQWDEACERRYAAVEALEEWVE